MLNEVKSTYYLDSPIRTMSTVTVSVTSNMQNPFSKGYLVGGELYTWVFTAESKNGNDVVVDLYADSLIGLYEDQYKDKSFGKVYYREGKIELYFDAPTVVDGQDNITVQFDSTENYLYSYTSVDINGNSTYYQLCPELEHSGILFFTFKDKLYFTEAGHKLYIPESNYININAKGIVPLTDNTVGAFTDKGITYLVRTEQTIGDEVKYTYKTYEGQTGEILASKDTIGILSNEPLFLCKNGIFTVKLSENIKSNERYAIERSSFINSVLTKHKDLSKAKAVVYKNRYYLAIDDVVYVADARYKTGARDIDMNDSSNYEWWIWENVPVEKWILMDDDLKFINKDGQLCEFTDDREDVKITLIGNRGGSFGYFAPINTSQYDFQFDLTKINMLKEDNEIEIYSTSGGSDTKIFRYVIKNVDKSKGTFRLKHSDSLETDEYVTNDIDFYNNPENEYYMAVVFVEKSNVVSEWYTPIINMGTDLYSKNLLTSTLVFEPNIEGDVKFGYLTRRKGGTLYKDSSLNTSEGLDFENIDFTDFSFAVGFAASRTLKTKVRNFNFIQFRIISDTNKDCALNNFTITYNISRKNKGVR